MWLNCQAGMLAAAAALLLLLLVSQVVGVALSAGLAVVGDACEHVEYAAMRHVFLVSARGGPRGGRCRHASGSDGGGGREVPFRWCRPQLRAELTRTRRA